MTGPTSSPTVRLLRCSEHRELAQHIGDVDDQVRFHVVVITTRSERVDVLVVLEDGAGYRTVWN